MNRLQKLQNQFSAAECAKKDSLSITDNRTGKTYELKITDGAIDATDLGKIKDEKGEVTRSFDPAYMNTVNCVSKVSFIDGDLGILEYRGYPIE
jgi:citrate synthase